MTAAYYQDIEISFRGLDSISGVHELKSSRIRAIVPFLLTEGEQIVPLTIDAGRPTILIRRKAYENAGLVRSELDSQFNLTDAEFRVEEDLVVVGSLPSDDLIGPITDYLEEAGLAYFDDFFELSGNWPEWLQIYAGQEISR